MNHKKEENTMINITFPDGNVKQFENGITAEAIAQSISPGLRKRCVAAKLNGHLYDNSSNRGRCKNRVNYK